MSDPTRFSACLGACLSDLVVAVYALVTENETDKSLQQRLLEIKASAMAIIKYSETLAKARENKLEDGN